MKDIRSQRSFGAWLDDRLGAGLLWRRLTAGTVERNGAWLRTTGMACLVLVLVECITGPILALYYSPSPTLAYADIQRIEQSGVGHFVRGLHHWASATLIILALLTVARMFFGGDFKEESKEGAGRRRDLVWIAALIFFQLVLLLQLTGHILPWDTNAVGTADVEAGIAANVWGVGPLIKRFLLGGASTSAATLTRWFGFHTAVLPALLVLLVGLPLLLARLRDGESEPPEARPTTRREPYYPFHMAREMAVALACFAIVAGLTLAARTPLEAEATAKNLQGYTARSEWYVMPLHALTLIRPFNNVLIEPVATVVLPGVIILALLLLPFYDRHPERRPARRPAATALGVVVLAGIVGLSAYAMMLERPGASGEPPTDTAELASQAAPTAADPPEVRAGKKLYAAQGCDGCHAIAGKGGNTGPDLTHAGTLHPDISWQEEHLKKPTAKSPGSTMPAYDTLKPDEQKALAAYMVSLK